MIKKPKHNKPSLKRNNLPLRPNKPQEKPTLQSVDPNKAERIAKVIARAGICSRREAERYIEEGRVVVNGKKLTSPAFTVTSKDKIVVDGKVLAEKDAVRLFLFHKPGGCLTTNRDDRGRQTIFDVLDRHEPKLPRLVTIGRLDYNTEGLLLLTNDGEFARHLEHPDNQMLRVYRVRAHGSVTQERLDSLKDGLVVSGIQYGAVTAVLEKQQGGNIWMSVSITEGKNREVRKIMESLGLEVNRLIRLSYGPFILGGLGKASVKEYSSKSLYELLPSYFGGKAS
jgi:23S rRNA pseudouridine2605 synthase